MSKIDAVSADPLIKNHLKKLLQKTPHCLLFEGPRGSDKETLADAFARDLLKTDKKDPPDLRHLYPEGKGNHHPIHTIRQMITETELPPFEAAQKVFIIHEAERMLPTSSNALLKTLEEPVSKVTFILLTSHTEALLPTITSRCIHLAFSQNEPDKEASIDEAMFHLGLSLLQKELPHSKKLPEITDPEKALHALLAFFRDLHLIQSGGDPSLLYHKEKEKILAAIKIPAPSLDRIHTKIERLLEATALHIPLSHGLATFI